MKKGFLIIGMAALALSVALVGCQTTTQGSLGNSIQTEQTGLAPTGDTQHSTIDFSLFLNNQDSIKSWKVEMVYANVSRKQWSGDAKNVPATVTWDGQGDAGLAPEGTYIAKLTVDYGTGTVATTQSQTFILDISAPTGSVAFSPLEFTPDSSGGVHPVKIAITGKSAVARMDSWSLDVFDQDGKSFHSFDGKWPSDGFTWDGKSIGGDWVAPSRSYVAQLTLRDEFGNTAQVSSSIRVADALPVRSPTGAGGGDGTHGPDKTIQEVAIAVTPGSRGFSPNGDTIMDTMGLVMSYGAQKPVSTWKVEILGSDNRSLKTFSGDSTNLPDTLSWDGKNDAGRIAEDGFYTARLSVVYGTGDKTGSAVSSSFVLDNTPPTGTVTLSDALFSPIEASPTITLNVAASSPLASIDSWKMEIYDPENHLFRSFFAKWPASSAVWDGKGFKGDLAMSAEDYPVLVRVRDEFGNVGRLHAVVPLDILVERIPTGFRILSSRIYFKAYTSDYKDVRPDLAAQNLRRLTDMAAKLKKFPNYNIRLVGHAVMIHWDNARLGNIEQRDVLLPLSRARADAVKNAMIDRGLESTAFTAQGVGAADPLVPDSDFADHWQNRRVAFFIER
jgi:outer membrane protein OmpA-like peptidoglycan-associated protein